MALTAASCLPAAVQAVIGLLQADAALVAAIGAAESISTRPADNLAPPYLWVLSGQEDRDPAGTMKTYSRVGTIEVLAVSQYEGTAEVDLIVSRVMQLLDNVSLTLPGYGTGRFEWVRNERLVVERINNVVMFERNAIFRVTAS